VQKATAIIASVVAFFELLGARPAEAAKQFILSPWKCSVRLLPDLNLSSSENGDSKKVSLTYTSVRTT
jgi:hypothetical protein